MTARILVVDDIPANVTLLEARLTADYFDVLTAFDGPSALKICASTQVDLILLDIMMPGMDGFEVCERLKADPKTAHIPVVIVTALDQRADRLRGLEAGADDFLTKPVNDLQLMSRVRSLVRLKALSDELRLRAQSAQTMGFESDSGRGAAAEDRAMILLVDGRAQSGENLARTLEPLGDVTITSDPQAALFEAAEKPYDLVITATNFESHDPLRLCAQLRSLERTRIMPILMVAEKEEDDLVRRALELGVNDFISRPVDAGELIARTRTQVRRQRDNERLRDSLQQSIELAITDALTGLHNRRYLDGHLRALVERAAKRGRPLSLCVIDIDSFKSINDNYGHDAGDDILREFARRIRGSVRGADMAGRYGGEEFVIAMPDTPAVSAEQIAERIRQSIEHDVFFFGAGNTKSIPVTASIGISTLDATIDTPESLMKRADEALYKAKQSGRNRVVMQAA